MRELNASGSTLQRDEQLQSYMTRQINTVSHTELQSHASDHRNNQNVSNNADILQSSELISKHSTN